MKKKKLIVVGLSLALMPGLLYAAPEDAQENIEMRLDLENVSALTDIFSGGVSSDEISALHASALDNVSVPVVKNRVASQPVTPVTVVTTRPTAPAVPLDKAETLIQVEIEVPESNAKERVTTVTSEPEALQLPAETVAETLSIDGEEAEETIILENFQKFSPAKSRVDYLKKASRWAEKAPKAGESYTFKSRLPASDQQSFKRAYLDKIAAGTLVDVPLVNTKGLTKSGESLYVVLLESEAQGMIPALYHVGRIENLLQSGDIAAHQAELNKLLHDGAMTYIRDLVLGMPEMKAKDPEWLLTGRSVNVAERYQKILQSGDVDAGIRALEPQYPEYQSLKRALRSFKEREQALEPAMIPQGPTIKAGMSGERITVMRDRLNYLGYEAGDADIYDAKMIEAVKAFQRTHLLEPDGAPGRRTIAELNRTNEDRIKQIEINLERWRWMPKSMGEHYVAVDIPGFRYSVMRDGAEVLSARTVVGRGDRKTPVFMSPMSYIVFSPYWHVPRSMAVRDFLPRLKRDPYALNRSRIKVLRGGQEVDPGSIDWSQYSSNNFPFQLRQDPGDHNSLGRVKFMFPNEHAIYLHDTPSKSLFNRTSRDFSSGCVRIENPEELAEYFLGEAGWNQKRIGAAFKRSSEAHVSLANDKKIPVYTLYMTTRVEGDTISFRADIYSKDKVLIETLKRLN